MTKEAKTHRETMIEAQIDAAWSGRSELLLEGGYMKYIDAAIRGHAKAIAKRGTRSKRAFQAADRVQQLVEGVSMNVTRTLDDRPVVKAALAALHLTDSISACDEQIDALEAELEALNAEAELNRA